MPGLCHLCLTFALVMVAQAGLATVAAASNADPEVIAADRIRITEHLRHVEDVLRSLDVSPLPEPLKRERLRNLERLHSYFTRGVYPHNTHHLGQRVPYFIDDDGRTCAMAQLIIDSGHPELARVIAASQNYLRLKEMQSTELLAWLAQSGLTIDEAAWIQPGYGSPCCCSRRAEPVCAENQFGGPNWTSRNECDAIVCQRTRVLHEGPCEVDGGSQDAAYPEYAWGYSNAPECLDRTRAPSCQYSGHPASPGTIPFLLLLGLAARLISRRTAPTAAAHV